MKKVLSIFLALALILSLCPVSVFAAEPQAGEAAQEDIPDPNVYKAYREPEEILSEDHGFSEGEIAAIRSEESTDERVGYAKTQEELRALIETPAVEVIVITTDFLEVTESLVIDRSLSILSFCEEYTTIWYSKDLGPGLNFIQISEIDGLPITDRDIDLRFSHVVVECYNNGRAIEIKGADETANSQSASNFLIEGATIRLRRNYGSLPLASSYCIYGKGNVSVIGCTFVPEYGEGYIVLTPTKFGTVVVKECNLFRLGGYPMIFQRSPDEKGGHAIIQNCNLFNCAGFVAAENIDCLEISDVSVTEFETEFMYAAANSIVVKNLSIKQPSGRHSSVAVAGSCDQFFVDNVSFSNTWPTLGFSGKKGKISNLHFIAENEKEKSGQVQLGLSNGLNGSNEVELENITVSGFKGGCSVSSSGENSEVTLRNVNVSDCDKGLILSGASINLEKCNVVDNAEVGLQGSVANLSITDSMILGNGYAKTADSRGGIYLSSLYNKLVEQVTINSSTIANNYSAISGGGLFIAEGDFDPTVNIGNGTSFTGNTAAQNGGAISMSNLDNLTTDETTIFESNKASKAYFPPKDAPEKYPNIKFASTSAAKHLLNNYDVSFVSEDPMPIAASVDTLDPEKVPLGTSADEVEKMLRSNVRSVTVRMNDGSFDSSPVTWDVLDSDYDGDLIGNYTIHGKFEVNKSKYVNPGNIQAIVVVTVESPDLHDVESVKMDFDPIYAPQYMLLGPTERSHAFYGVPSTVDLPETTYAVLYNGEQIELPIKWDTSTYDPTFVSEESKVIFGEYDLSAYPETKNPHNFEPAINVITTATQYEVLGASTDGLSLEVLPGTSLAGIQAQLEKEGKAEVHVWAICDLTNADEFVYCPLNLTDADNPNWIDQMDEPGEYELKVSLPNDFTELIEGCLDESEAKVKVTVLQPLEIVDVEEVFVDTYQSVDPENLENIPSQVAAVLSNGNEIPVDVEWKWNESGYQKDLVGDQFVIGELVNLPSRAKLPEDKDIVPVLTANVVHVDYEVTDTQYEDLLEAKALLTLEEITELLNPTATLTISSVTPGITMNTTYEANISLETEKNPDFNRKKADLQPIIGTLNTPSNIEVSTGVLLDDLFLFLIPAEVQEIEPMRILVGEGTEFEDIEKPDTVTVTFDTVGPDGEYKKESVKVNWGSGEGYTPYPEDLTEETPVEMTIYGQLSEESQLYANTAEVPVPLTITVVRAYEITKITPNRFPEIGAIEVKLGSTLEDISNALETKEVELELQSMSGNTSTATVTFQIREEDNPHYDPMTEGAYTLTAFLNLPPSISNPKDLQVEVVVKTKKYSISSVQVARVEGVVSGTVFEDVPMPDEVTVNLTGNGTDVVGVAQWDGSSYNPTKIGSQAVRGTLGELPVHLTNPNNRQPSAIVTVVNPEAKVVSLEPITAQTVQRTRAASVENTSVPGYKEYRYLVTIRQKDGMISEEIISVYVETATTI